jgi:hypothetical protein
MAIFTLTIQNDKLLTAIQNNKPSMLIIDAKDSQIAAGWFGSRLKLLLQELNDTDSYDTRIVLVERYYPNLFFEFGLKVSSTMFEVY